MKIQDQPFERPSADQERDKAKLAAFDALLEAAYLAEKQISISNSNEHHALVKVRAAIALAEEATR